MKGQASKISRRALLKYGAAGFAGIAITVGAQRVAPLLPEVNVGGRGFNLGQGAASLIGSGSGGQTDSDNTGQIEDFPASPLILAPFRDPLPIPKALAPVPLTTVATWSKRPGPGKGQQDALGGTHQLWPSQLGLPDPLIYQIQLQVRTHSFSSSSVRTMVTYTDPSGKVIPAGTTVAKLPESTICGFNGTFPGPRINAEYGKPAIVRFENHMDENHSLDYGDYGSPEYGFLTHLHNGHTAPESDGNPHYLHHHAAQAGFPGRGGYLPGEWVDNLYLNYPAGGDDAEKQSFFWFHDHFHNHTGANVYKGMVGLYPIYDPKNGMDMGDETKGLRLPGVRTNNPDGSFDVDYDIPLAFYDVALDDGNVRHQDFHNGHGERHPEWWGKTFFRHYPNHGFVGDIFTVNCTAYPVLEVKRRKYRLRFLCASISRIYEFKLMSSSGGPKTALTMGYSGKELQGQYRLPDGQQCMRFTQIASEGGLLEKAIVRDSFELWPAKRREFIVDFTKYMDGSATKKGDVIYLVNTLKMLDGRQPNSPDPNYKIPVLKIVIGDDAPDNSVMPTAQTVLRPLSPLPEATWKSLLPSKRTFKLERGSFGGEIQWLINGRPFDENVSLAAPKRGSAEVWEIVNGGGGWVHPMHFHEEEHRVVMRNGKPAPDARHPDDTGREDVVALDPGESVVMYRKFRMFTGRLVAHCHNLAHEDHAMMFGWEIVP